MDSADQICRLQWKYFLLIATPGSQEQPRRTEPHPAFAVFCCRGQQGSGLAAPYPGSLTCLCCRVGTGGTGCFAQLALSHMGDLTLLKAQRRRKGVHPRKASAAWKQGLVLPSAPGDRNQETSLGTLLGFYTLAQTCAARFLSLGRLLHTFFWRKAALELV